MYRITVNFTNYPSIFKLRCKYLRCLSAASITPDQHDRVVIDGANDFVFHGEDRKLLALSLSIGELIRFAPA